jgi:hypothetical protein
MTVFTIRIFLKSILLFSLIEIFTVSSLAQKKLIPTEQKLGFNFPFRPEIIDINKFMTMLKEINVSYIRQMTLWDIDWNKIESTDNNWNWTWADSAIKNDFNIIPIPTFFSHSGKDTFGIQVPWLACNQPGCRWKADRDSNYTKDYIAKVIERYKNYTNLWEIGNEMDSRAAPPTGLIPSQFADFLKLVYRWIKQNDPGALVLLPGLSGTYPSPLSIKYQWLRDLLRAGGGSGFDIMNYHDYYPWWTLPCHFDSIMTILRTYNIDNYPVWITESSVTSDRTSEIAVLYASETEQAADTWRRTAILFSKGAKKVLWHSFWSSGGVNNPWKEFGVINASGKKKQAYHSYKMFINTLENFVSVSALSYGQAKDDTLNGGNGVWAIQFICIDGVKRWVIWSPDKQTYTLSGLTYSAVNVTDVVPSSVSPDGETATFNSYKSQISNNAITFANLTGLPIVVEEDVTSPTKIRLSSPENFATKISTSPTLYWLVNNQGEIYQLQISMDSNFQNTIFNDSTISTNFKQINTLTNNTTYYWRVRAKKSGFVSEWSEEWNFTTIVSKPNAPTLLSPLNGQIGVSVNAVFNWSYEGNGTSYQLQISRDPNFSPVDIDSTGINLTSKEIAGLKSNVAYYWRIKAFNDAGESSWSTTWSFTTALLLPYAPKLSSPVNNFTSTSVNIKFIWFSSQPSVSKYSLEITSDSLFLFSKIIDSTIIDTTKTVSQLSDKKEYWWRVKAKNASGWGQYSETRKFKISLPSSKAKDEKELPVEYRLEQNYPNPFNSMTKIEFSIPERQFITLRVFDFLGKELATLVNEELGPGQYSVHFDAKSLSSGSYYYQLKTPMHILTKIMQLVK